MTMLLFWLVPKRWVNINLKIPWETFLCFLMETKIFFFCLELFSFCLNSPEWPRQNLSLQYQYDTIKFKFWLFIPPLSKLVTRNLVLDQDKNFYLMSLNFLITCLLDKVWRWQEEVTCESLLGVRGLSKLHSSTD